MSCTACFRLPFFSTAQNLDTPEEETHLDTYLASHSGNNSDFLKILPRILLLLPVNDLKTCRLTCKSWNTEARTILREKSIIKVNFKNLNYSFGKETNAKSKLSDVKSFDPINLSITSLEDSNLTLESIEYLKKSIPNSAKYLHLLLVVETDLEFHLCRNLLKHFPHLTELSYSIYIQENLELNKFNSTIFPEFASLRKIIVFQDETFPSKIPLNLEQNVPKLFGNGKIEEITLKSFLPSKTFLETVVKTTLISNITVIDIGKTDVEDLALLQSFSNLRRIHISYFCSKRFYISESVDSDLVEFQDVAGQMKWMENANKLFEKNSMTLEKIELDLIGIWESGVAMQFPILKNLVSLSLVCSKNTKFLFYDDLEVYSKHFPKVKYLSLSAECGDEEVYNVFVETFTQFFPENEVCETLRGLEILNVLTHLKYGKEYKELLKKCKALFPNCEVRLK